MKTIAQQLNVKKFPFEIKDENGNRIYYENSAGYWEKQEYNFNGNKIYYEDSDGYWVKREFDSQGNETHLKNSNGFWKKREFDSEGNEIYYQDSQGYVFDKRPKPTVELTLEDIAKLAGVPVEQIKIKK